MGADAIVGARAVSVKDIAPATIVAGNPTRAVRELEIELPVKPRLIFVNRFYWPYESATAQLLTDLAEHLAEQGFAAKIITGNRGWLYSWR